VGLRPAAAAGSWSGRQSSRSASMYLRAGFEIVREDAEGNVIVRKPLL
jgi:hypothetical protein